MTLNMQKPQAISRYGYAVVACRGRAPSVHPGHMKLQCLITRGLMRAAEHLLCLQEEKRLLEQNASHLADAVTRAEAERDALDCQVSVLQTQLREGDPRACSALMVRCSATYS